MAKKSMIAREKRRTDAAKRLQAKRAALKAVIIDPEVSAEDAMAAVFAGPYNESFLNRFDGTSILLLSEYIQSWSASSYNMAGSIEVSVTDILSVIVKSVSTGTYRDGGTVKAQFFWDESQ